MQHFFKNVIAQITYLQHQALLHVHSFYLKEVGSNIDPCFSTFPTRMETSGTHKHLANNPTSDGSKY